MAKLNQIIAIEKGVKSRVYAEVSELHKANQKPALFNGFSKSYQANDEDGEKLPPERQRVQFEVHEVLSRVDRALTELIDVTARKDYTNCYAKADVVVDGKTIVGQAPVPFLLFLEKQLTDMRAFVAALPVLDEAETWARDPNSGLYKTDGIQTHRTKKVQKALVLYNATPEHPAQTQLVTEDIIAGYWTQVKMSGAMPKPEKDALLERVETLLKAVKQAREAANMCDEVGGPSVGVAIFDYLLRD